MHHHKHRQHKGPAISSIVGNSEEPLPSLSDLHDCEPKLEFDDTELLTPAPLESKKIYPKYLHIMNVND